MRLRLPARMRKYESHEKLSFIVFYFFILTEAALYVRKPESGSLSVFDVLIFTLLGLGLLITMVNANARRLDVSRTEFIMMQMCSKEDTEVAFGDLLERTKGQRTAWFAYEAVVLMSSLVCRRARGLFRKIFGQSQG
ncbi:hypothetical protein ASD8599_00385 [Ascidiaceihabitans donghaensis]|uniref:Uncharacterized protein n=1 Tax=Ascidiaceihabitans donghaensis TaxID=1510460 RepID=A0A2R8B9D6_9RHOB|nr:hypothetical protein [Ascidiaceihabitans donghaensis]SPH19650.1 hypothetical protein ASD8599_00385 [Ascidiaceihabitans donghaensis]